jgi:cell volume regulation protein A
VIGFLGNLLFHRTGFPDVLFLMFLGILFGPVLRIFPHQSLLPILPYFTTLTLALILFGGGMEMEIYSVLRQSGRAVLLAVVHFILLIFGVTLFVYFAFGMSWLQGLMLGTILSGTSSVVILPLTSRLNLDKQTSLTLSLESVMDNFYIILFFVALEAHLGSFPRIQDALSSILAKFSIGTVLGFMVGVFWIKALYVVRREKYTYMLTIAMVILTYTISELFGGSGALSSLVLGLVLGNAKSIIKLTKSTFRPDALKKVRLFLKRFQGEISFLMRSFFFVFLGLIYEVAEIPFLVAVLSGLALTSINLVLRYLAVYIATLKSKMASNRGLITLMCGKGLSCAALSVIPLEHNLPDAYIYTIFAANLILLTNIVTSLSVFWAKNLSNPKE